MIINDDLTKLLVDVEANSCPVCQYPMNILDENTEHVGPRSLYHLAMCDRCGVLYRVGKSFEECSRCRIPFPDDPYDDVNSIDSHWSHRDQTYYCTACYFALFFEGYIDLSLSDPDIDNMASAKWDTPDLLWCTHINNPIAKYVQRIKARGFENVAVVDKSELNKVRKICADIARSGKRYMVIVEWHDANWTAEEGFP